MTEHEIKKAGEIYERLARRYTFYQERGYTREQIKAMPDVVEDWKRYGEFTRLAALKRSKETKGIEELERMVGLANISDERVHHSASVAPEKPVLTALLLRLLCPLLRCGL